jgi:DNA primase
MLPADACAGISPLKAILSICFARLAWSTLKAATPSTVASSSPCSHGGRIVNLYGRSLGDAFAHRFLPRPKGGLYAWEQVRHCPEVILVEGLFDYAVLWQAGFRHATCSLGTHLNADQFQQLCDRPRTVYLTFDVDSSGQQASQQLAHRLQAQGIATRRVHLPDGHDPNSFFVQGGDARQFHSLLAAAQP